MGIAHHSNYAVWFEIGRTDLCRATGIPYATIEGRGFILVVVELQCRFRLPFRYDEQVIIRTTVLEAGSRMLTFGYELLDEEGMVRASGSTRHIWLDRESRKPVKADDDVIDAFAPYLPQTGR